MIRARFRVNGEDYRPVVWPITHPYWCSGYSGDGDHAIIVAYADDTAEILRLWPDAEEIDVMDDPAEYHFTDRFSCPKWFTLPTSQAKV